MDAGITTPSASPSPQQQQAHIKALLDGPAHHPPPGVVSNFENPWNLHPTIILILTLCMIITTISVLIRAYTKLFLFKSTAYEDFSDALALAWMGQIGFLVPSVYDFKVGGGSHMWDIRLKDYFKLLYWFNIGGILYGVVVSLIKFSILLQFLRIFVPSRQNSMPLFITIWTVFGCIFIFYFVDLIFGIIMCIPREKIWNPLMKTGHCFNEKAAYIASGIFNIFSDFAILFIPIIPIKKLQMPLKRKITMLAIFATGFFACITSILRTYYTFKIIQSPDVGHNVIVMGLWIWAEITCGIVIACLPTMPRFFRDTTSKIHGIYSSSTRSGTRSKSQFRSLDSAKKNVRNISPSDQHLKKSSSHRRNSDAWSEAHEHPAFRTTQDLPMDEFENTSPPLPLKGAIRKEQGRLFNFSQKPGSVSDGVTTSDWE
ncbi:MAG: hypothetical protein Q9217_000853 [Psora testacea]